MSKSKSFALLISLLLCVGVSPNAVAQTDPVEGVRCSSTDGSQRSSRISLATVQPTSQGYDLLIVDDVGTYIFTLKPDLTIREVSSLEGEERIPWNLTAYDGSPISLSLHDGTFAIEMMVSTRSFCSFQGRAQILDRT